ncbi:ArnT family glycosyltransferase [Phaeacidiphilus oryzae]|uniref:ArnT family glycosyltransferase n=1 Tax=Phaeacidiphilus oryzae TaxID=348818 RepID=UPI00068D6EDB|nr:glycosyltransferase family 39 protein [Phaeacidiphilus oryzae]
MPSSPPTAAPGPAARLGGRARAGSRQRTGIRRGIRFGDGLGDRLGDRGRRLLGEPRWARPALLGIAVLAAVLYAWGLGRSQYEPFYAGAVRSMTESWKAFFFGSSDPGNTITLDKLPGFLWPQALSARVFGFHPWSVMLPQIAEGVLSVLVLYRAVRRWTGPAAGLIAAAAFAFTPAVVGLFRGATEEPVFTLLLLLAAEAALRGTREGRLRPLAAAGLWVGLAFQAKMLEAWAVLPVLAAVHLAAAPGRFGQRLRQVLAAGAVAVLVSASWMLAVAAVPQQDRPYLDGTTDDSPVSLVVQNDFLNRFTAGGAGSTALGHGLVDSPPVPGSFPASGWFPSSSSSWASARADEGGLGKLFGSPLSAQAGWLYPFAGLAAVGGLAARRRRPRTDPERAGWLLWTGWLGVFAAAFSLGAVGGHSYYLGVLAAAPAALTGAGAMLFWRALGGSGAGSRPAAATGRTRAWSWAALPVALGSTVVWDLVVARRFPGFLPWIGPAALLLGAVALGLLVLGRGTLRRSGGRPGRGRRVAVTGLAAALAAVLLAPTAWASSVLLPRYEHRSGVGGVGPFAANAPAAARTAAAGGSGRTDGGAGAASPAGSPSGAAARSATGDSAHRQTGQRELTAAQHRLLDYTRQHADGARYDFATASWAGAEPYILAAGAPVLPMGGVTGQAPAPRLADFEDLVGDEELRYVLLGPDDPAPGAADNTGRIISWVRIACLAVPPQEYGDGGSAWDGEQLYDCIPHS